MKIPPRRDQPRSREIILGQDGKPLGRPRPRRRPALLPLVLIVAAVAIAAWAIVLWRF